MCARSCRLSGWVVAAIERRVAFWLEIIVHREAMSARPQIEIRPRLLFSWVRQDREVLKFSKPAAQHDLGVDTFSESRFPQFDGAQQ